MEAREFVARHSATTRTHPPNSNRFTSQMLLPLLGFSSSTLHQKFKSRVIGFLNTDHDHNTQHTGHQALSNNNTQCRMMHDAVVVDVLRWCFGSERTLSSPSLLCVPFLAGIEATTTNTTTNPTQITLVKHTVQCCLLCFVLQLLRVACSIFPWLSDTRT